jgi:hypothetical protein
MSLFATVEVDNSIELPHFPNSIDRDEMTWQTKSNGLQYQSMRYRVDADGHFLRKEKEYREKTDEEKLEEAQQWGYNSWDEYATAYEEKDDSEYLHPESIDYEIGDDESPPVGMPKNDTIDEVFWVDHSPHGSIEIHQSIRENPTHYIEMEGPDGTVERPDEWELDVLLSYELRYSRGELDETVFMGERFSDRSVEDVIADLEEWDSNNE